MDVFDKLDELDRKYNSNIPEDVMKKVEEALEEKFKDYSKGLGFCHVYWSYKKAMLNDLGYNWMSPSELAESDPECGTIMFD
ncbi:MAG: hypothetical protein K6G10_04790 [Butyrivibrio sp.]|nr:hypothetical protein [Butyrivibrio sp.]